MSHTEEVFALSLSQMGLRAKDSSVISRKLVSLAGTSIQNPHDPSVGDVVKNFSPCWEDQRGSAFRSFEARLIHTYHLTRLDWVCLPQSTVTDEAIRDLSKAELLKAPLVCIPRFGPDILRAVATRVKRLRHPVESLTVAHALTISPAETAFIEPIALRRRTRIALRGLVLLLRDKGAADDEGPLMQMPAEGEKITRPE